MCTINWDGKWWTDATAQTDTAHRKILSRKTCEPLNKNTNVKTWLIPIWKGGIKAVIQLRKGRNEPDEEKDLLGSSKAGGRGTRGRYKEAGGNGIIIYGVMVWSSVLQEIGAPTSAHHQFYNLCQLQRRLVARSTHPAGLRRIRLFDLVPDGIQWGVGALKRRHLFRIRRTDRARARSQNLSTNRRPWVSRNFTRCSDGKRGNHGCATSWVNGASSRPRFSSSERRWTSLIHRGLGVEIRTNLG